MRGLSLVVASGGPLFIAVRGPLTVTASPVAEHRLQTRRLSSCGSQAQLLRGMWDPPRPGPEPVSPALAGRPSTTAPPGKPKFCLFLRFITYFTQKCKIHSWFSCVTVLFSLVFMSEKTNNAVNIFLTCMGIRISSVLDLLVHVNIHVLNFMW